MLRFDNAMSFAVGQVVLGIASNNWIAAAQGVHDAVNQIEPSQERIVRRATKRTAAALKEWLEAERVSDDDLVNGFEIAEQVVSHLSAEQYADLAREFGIDSVRMARVMVESYSSQLGSASKLVAIQTISTSLEELEKQPKFQERLERAIAWATYRAVEQLRSELQKTKSDEMEQEAARIRQLRDSLQRHSRTRVAALGLGHNKRKLYGTTGTELSRVITKHEHWRSEIERETSTLASAILCKNPRSSLARSIRRIDLRGTYEAVHLSLVKAEALFANAEALFRDHKDSEKPTNEEKYIIARIRQEINRPRYRTAVFIAGRWGAGKSRLLAEIAASLVAGQSNQVVLRPSIATGSRLDEAILDEVQAASGRHYRSLSDFATDLRAIETTAVVFIDNVDQLFPTREDLDRTTQMMLDATRIDQVRWVFSVDSWHLDRVFSPESTPRWDRMSTYRRTTQTVTNWIDLDSHETGGSLGNSIVARELGHRPVLSPAMGELLDIPLNAWLFIESSQTPATSEFDEKFWEEVLSSLTWGKEERRVCTVVSDVLTGLFAESLGEPAFIADVLARAVGISSNEIGNALDVLSDAHLLHQSDDGRMISLKSSPLWAGRIARSILSPKVLTGSQEPRDLFSFAMGFDTELAEQLIMHILIGVSSDTEFMNRCVGFLLDGQEVPKAGIWAAAISNINVRDAVVGVFRQSGTAYTASQGSAHDVYLLLRLWSSIKDALPFVAFLRQLVPCYETVGGNGLQLLLHEVIDDLSNADVSIRDSRKQLLHTADGIERALAAPQFAKRWVEESLRIVEPPNLLAEVDDFLRNDAARTDGYTESANREGPWRSATAPFGMHLVDAFTSQVAEMVGARFAYALFESKGWLDEDDPPYGTNHEVRSACHVGLGHSYMYNNQAVKDLLESLVRGTRVEQTSAIFILRHTGPTSGRHGVHVPVELRGFIDQLNSSKRLDRAVKIQWLKPMIK